MHQVENNDAERQQKQQHHTIMRLPLLYNWSHHFALTLCFDVVLRYLFQQRGLHALAPPAGRPDWIWEHPGPAAQILHSGKRQTNKAFVNVLHLRKCAAAH